MKGNLRVILFFSLIFQVEVFSSPKAPSTKKIMDEVFYSFVELIPYMGSEKKFKDPKNETKIQEHLLNLSKTFSAASHQKKMHSLGFRPSVDVIKEHISETIDVFNLKRKVFALKRLQALGGLCSSCHSQLPELGSGNFSRHLNSVTLNQFSSKFDYAEFLYTIRKYNKSVRYYIDSINDRLKINKNLKGKKNIEGDSDFTEKNLNTSLKRILSIFTKVNYNPQRARSLMEGFQNNSQISQVTREEIKDWIVELKKWEGISLSINNEKDLDLFIKNHLSILNSQGEAVNAAYDIVYLIASGKLFKFINAFPTSPSTPKALYYLGKAERRLNNNYFYSLSELYLEECIHRFSKNPFAKKCFEQYEDDLVMGFTGTAGTSIPEDEKAKLEALRKILK